MSTIYPYDPNDLVKPTIKIMAAGTIFCLILVGALYLIRPTEEDIQACMAATEYTYDRCEWELGR